MEFGDYAQVTSLQPKKMQEVSAAGMRSKLHVSMDASDVTQAQKKELT